MKIFGIFKEPHYDDIDIGYVFDVDNNQYMLTKIKLKNHEDFVFCLKQGDNILNISDIVHIKFNLQKGLPDVNIKFIDYLSLEPAVLKSIVDRSILTNDVLDYLWVGHIDKIKGLRDLILLKQNIFINNKIINSLSIDDWWVVFTQNNYRKKINLIGLETKVEELLIFILKNFLTEEYVKNKDSTYESDRILSKSILNMFNNLDIDRIINEGSSFIEFKINENNKKLSELDFEIKVIKTFKTTNPLELIQIESILKKLTDEIKVLKVQQTKHQEHILRIKNYLY